MNQTDIMDIAKAGGQKLYDRTKKNNKFRNSKLKYSGWSKSKCITNNLINFMMEN